jgi:hypothetical protein
MKILASASVMSIVWVQVLVVAWEAADVTRAGLGRLFFYGVGLGVGDGAFHADLGAIVRLPSIPESRKHHHFRHLMASGTRSH